VVCGALGDDEAEKSAVRWRKEQVGAP
jgi:hypothetical protein